MGSEIIRRCGPDSYAGRVAAVMLGASETSLYTISVYSGHLGLNRTRYAVFAALCGVWQHLPPLQHWLEYISHTVNIISCMLKNYHSLCQKLAN